MISQTLLHANVLLINVYIMFKNTLQHSRNVQILPTQCLHLLLILWIYLLCLTYRPAYTVNSQKNQLEEDVLSFPAKIIEIWSPRLNAWLNKRRVWNSDTKGNHDNTTIGMNITSPITASYALANSLTESQIPIPFKQDLHAWAICVVITIVDYSKGKILKRTNSFTCNSHNTISPAKHF